MIRYYFLRQMTTDRKREEIIIPNDASSLRLRLEENSVEIKFRWYKNYRFTKIVTDFLFEDFKGLASAFAFLFNKTKVVVNQDNIEIKHTPLKLLPNATYKSQDVKQLYVKRIPQRMMLAIGLYVSLKSGEEKILLWNLDDRVLLFLEQEIERVLGIEDKEVRGEIT